MSKENFRMLFFRLYDKKIASGEISFSRTGIKKDDFTKLCTDKDFFLDRDTVERLQETMKLSQEEFSGLMEAAGYSENKKNQKE